MDRVKTHVQGLDDIMGGGVPRLKMHQVSNVAIHRRIRIVKMRGTRHETGYMALHAATGELEVGRVLGG